MKKLVLFCAIFSLASLFDAQAQLSPETIQKRMRRKNLTVKEWNTDARSRNRWLDRVTTYDEEGRKIEEIEYASYGQKWRETYEYGPNGKVVKDVYYDDRNKPTRIRKYEYNEDGTKRKQYNYLPNGKLESVKIYEYIISDPQQ